VIIVLFHVFNASITHLYVQSAIKLHLKIFFITKIVTRNVQNNGIHNLMSKMDIFVLVYANKVILNMKIILLDFVNNAILLAKVATMKPQTTV